MTTLRRADADAGPSAVRQNLTQRLDAEPQPIALLVCGALFVLWGLGAMPPWDFSHDVDCHAPNIEQGGCGFWLEQYNRDYWMLKSKCQMDLGTAHIVASIPQVERAAIRGPHEMMIETRKADDLAGWIKAKITGSHVLVP